MKMKNKELKKLFDVVEPYYDMVSLPSVMTSFMACDDAIEDEIAALKAELTDAKKGRTIFRYNADNLRVEVLVKSDELRKANNQIDELKEKLNNERKHGEDLADVNGKLASENADLKEKTSNQVRLLEHSRITWRARAQHAEKEVEDLKKKISELEEENANLRVTPPSDTLESLKKENIELRNDNEALANTVEQYKKTFLVHCKEGDRLREVIGTLENEINDLKKKIHELKTRNENLKRSNGILRGDNETLWARLEECDISTREQAYKSLVEAIEFQNKKIEELEAEKARLKEAYDIHETTTKKENVDLSYGHEFEFGDEVFVPWSDGPYMYVKTGLLYNTRTQRLVYVGKDQHLKWFGDKF